MRNIHAAIERVERSRFSFWDALIIETAREAGAAVLWTEDLSSGQEVDGLRIENPFEM